MINKKNPSGTSGPRDMLSLLNLVWSRWNGLPQSWANHIHMYNTEWLNTTNVCCWTVLMGVIHRLCGTGNFGVCRAYFKSEFRWPQRPHWTKSRHWIKRLKEVFWVLWHSLARMIALQGTPNQTQSIAWCCSVVDTIKGNILVWTKTVQMAFLWPDTNEQDLITFMHSNWLY